MAEDDLYSVLIRFHREVVREDMRQMEIRLRDHVRDVEKNLRNEMLSHFDGVHQRLDRVESELAALKAAVARIEARLGEPQDESERAALQEQIRELKRKVADLQRRLDELEESAGHDA